jgi:glycerophosphoryl diester phosphodiesterase
VSSLELLEARVPLLLGHRGEPVGHGENTLAGFAAALGCGADGVELDVQVTADGVPVVIHDATLDRTTSARGRVDALTRAQLPPEVPSLRDVLLAMRGHVIAVELKPSYDADPTLAVRVLECIAETGTDDDAMVLAFDHRHLAAGASLLRGRGVMLFRDPPQAPSKPVALWWEHITPELCAQVPVLAWTVDDVDAASALQRMGVAAIISNRPRALRAALVSPRR